MRPVTGVSCRPAIFHKLYLLPQIQPVENPAKVAFQQLFFLSFLCPLSLSHPFHPPPPPQKKEKQFYSTLPLFLFQSNSLFPLSLTATTTFCNNEFVSEGRSEQRSGRRKKKKEKKRKVREKEE